MYSPIEEIKEIVGLISKNGDSLIYLKCTDFEIKRKWIKRNDLIKINKGTFISLVVIDTTDDETSVVLLNDKFTELYNSNK
jgi:hypothetical protein